MSCYFWIENSFLHPFKGDLSLSIDYWDSVQYPHAARADLSLESPNNAQGHCYSKKLFLILIGPNFGAKVTGIGELFVHNLHDIVNVIQTRAIVQRTIVNGYMKKMG
ncbi:MAG: hypothetical protein Aureis2KO_31660 [Aureisphaera sp.]